MKDRVEADTARYYNRMESRGDVAPPDEKLLDELAVQKVLELCEPINEYGGLNPDAGEVLYESMSFEAWASVEQPDEVIAGIAKAIVTKNGDGLLKIMRPLFMEHFKRLYKTDLEDEYWEIYND